MTLVLEYSQVTGFVEVWDLGIGLNKWDCNQLDE